ncbi:hypothetical protein [Streptomyces viridochromogenes]|nr:hypothetical protein [Streptomyces viridochromogenes]
MSATGHGPGCQGEGMAAAEERGGSTGLRGAQPTRAVPPGIEPTSLAAP